MQIGIAGLGRMGAAIAARLMDVGHNVAVWNRSPGKTKALTGAGAVLAATPADLSRQSDVIITMLMDADAIEQVYHGERGLLSGDVSGKLFIDMSTVRPGTEIALATSVRAKGARFVECPVGGTVAPAREGKLFGFMGADPDDAERAKPILDQLCRRLEHVGPVGNGALTKFTINMPLMIYLQSLGEALAMARPLGLAPERLMDMLADSSGATSMLKARAPLIARMLKGEEADVTFPVEGCLKDLLAMQAEGRARGLALPLVERTVACFSETVSRGLGAKESTAHPVYWATKT